MMKSKNLQYAFYVEYYEKLPEILKKQKEFKEKPKKQNNSKKEKKFGSCGLQANESGNPEYCPGNVIFHAEIK